MRRSSKSTLSGATTPPPDPDDRRNIRLNSTWNALQQVVNVASGSLFSIALVWVLPLSDYGVYSYAIALCSVGLAVTTAGLSGLGIKYIVSEGAAGTRSVAAILLIRELFCVAAFLIIGAVSFTADSRVTTLVTLVALTSLFFRGLDAPELWYLAHMRSRRPAMIRMISVSIMLTVRVISMFAWPHLWVFIGIYVAEAALTSIWILWRFHLDRDAKRMARPSRKEIGSMLRTSSPLALSAIANQVNLRADVVIIQPVLGSAAVGVYSLAARASELAYILPIVIMNSTLPVLLRALAESKETGSDTRYRQMLQVSYNRAFQSGVAIAVIVTGLCLSPIRKLFSADLQPVFDVLIIHIWASPLVFMGAVYSKWIIAEGFLWSSLTRHTAGAIVNIALVFALIHPFGLKGAALATVTSYAVANYFATFLGKKSRLQGYCMTRAFVSPVTDLVGLARSRRSGRRKRL